MNRPASDLADKLNRIEWRTQPPVTPEAEQLIQEHIRRWHRHQLVAGDCWA